MTNSQISNIHLTLMYWRFTNRKKYLNGQFINDSYFRSHLEIFHHANFFARSMHFNPLTAIERADSAESIRAFESFPFTSAHRGIASFATAPSSRQPFQLFRRVSWILLLNGERVCRMSSITRRYDMLAARITIAFEPFHGPMPTSARR